MDRLLDFMVFVEGKKNRLYKDSSGYSTIGVGHKLTKSERGEKAVKIKNEFVHYQGGLTDQQVYQLLEQDLAIYKAIVADSVKVELDDNQFIALVSFCFNVGGKRFQESKLLERVNQKRFKRVPYELMRWIKAFNPATGRLEPFQGLVNRRTKELVMWLTGEF